MTKRHTTLLVAAALIGAWTTALAQGTRPDVGAVPDAYGYVVVDQSDSRCAFDFIDIGVGGDAVWFTASDTAPADDDGGAVIPLGGPFELYGAALPGLVMSTNGYVAGASSLTAEAGGDFSNDPTLPSIPDNAPAAPARLLVYHSDLNALAAAGTAYNQFFGLCPRPSESVGSEACTILQWTDWAQAGGVDTFEFQAVLYHTSFQIVYQIRPGSSGLAGGTVGIQNRDATDASQYRFAEVGLVADTAICFFDPRYPAGGRVADLSVFKNDKVDGIGPGAQVTYAVSVINDGPSPVYGAAVQDTLPSTLLNCTWICEFSEGSSCTATGSGDIDELADIEAGGWVDYWLTCQAAVSRGEVVNAATVTVPVNVIDPDTSNNTSTDVNRILNDPWVCRTPLTRGGLVSPEQASGEPNPACRSRVTGRAAERGAARD
jgi:uncharacterized repeat protein (TIGR01451 family)